MPCPSSARRRAGAASAAFLLASWGVAPAAAQDGPGYGGTADELAVSWAEQDQLLAMGPAGPGIELEQSSLALAVHGVGFRGRSEVVITVGTNDPVTARVDPTGTLELSVDLDRAGEGPQPGTSVVALGRAPGGTSRTLVGAVPPIPAGTGPADLVPWIVGVGLAGAGIGAVRRRRMSDSAV